jgi:hypothetical protein
MCSSTHSLTSAVDGGELSASRPSCFTPRERAPSTHWIGGSVGSRFGLDAVVKRKIPAPAGTRTLDHPARSPALYRLPVSQNSRVDLINPKHRERNSKWKWTQTFQTLITSSIELYAASVFWTLSFKRNGDILTRSFIWVTVLSVKCCGYFGEVTTCNLLALLTTLITVPFN